MKVFTILTALAFTLCVSPVLADNTNLEILLDKIKADKKLLIASNMDLTEKEGKEFWGIYTNYQKDLDSLNGEIGHLIKEYADSYNAGAVTEKQATHLIHEWLENEQAEVTMREDYAKKLSKILPSPKVARYLQMENKIRAAIKFDLSNNIPLME